MDKAGESRQKLYCFAK